jgi:pyruvate formate lyase activating enzyme
MGFWLEVVTLLVPGFNDSREELEELTRFLAHISPDIPWHVTAFHGDYKMQAIRATTAKDLLVAVQIGRESGLRFVYAGNLPGVVGELENTYCPGCETVLVKRQGYRIHLNRMPESGQCPDCGNRIPGVWSKTPRPLAEADRLLNPRFG